MHSISEFGANVPAFLAKLWRMVEDPSTNDLILWSPSGSSFLIRDQARFCKELLPMYYKHNNMASFIRQLNMYGFHKIVSVDAGSTKLEQDENEFHHPCFIKDHPYMLEHIKRKITGSKIEGGNGRSEIVNKVLTDVRQMRNRQETMDSRLSQMKLENEALWRELALLRQKHLKQQQIVNKLIQFLVSLVQHPHNNGISVKRRLPLMLQDKNGRRSQPSRSDQNTIMKSPSGPVIHELDPAEYANALLNTVEDDDGLTTEPSEQFITVEPSIEEAETMLESVDKEINSGHATLADNENIIAEHFLIDSATDILPNDESASASLLKTPVLTSINALKVEKPPAKRGKAKKKKPKKYVIGTTGSKESTSVINNIMIVPEIAGAGYEDCNSLTDMIDPIVTSNPSPGLSHITPDTFNPVTELDTTINLDDLRIEKIGPETASSQPIKNNNTASCSVVPAIINTEPPSVEPCNNSRISSKVAPKRKYNIGKNASLFLKSKNAKPLFGVQEKKQKKQGNLWVEMNQQTSPIPDIAETISKPASSPVVSKDSSSLVPDDNIVQNSDMTVACTTGNSNTLSRYSGIEENCNNSFRRVNDIDNHVDAMQNDIESLKELLKCENLSLDANALLGLFNADDTMGYNNLDVLNTQPVSENLKESDSNSNKITMYSAPPAILDFNDVFNGSEWSLPGTPDPFTGNDLSEDLFPEINTPVVSLSQPSYGPPAKKKKK